MTDKRKPQDHKPQDQKNDDRRKDEAKPDSASEQELRDELEDSFPASDPPSVTQPGGAPGAPKDRKGTNEKNKYADGEK